MKAVSSCQEWEQERMQTISSDMVFPFLPKKALFKITKGILAYEYPVIDAIALLNQDAGRVVIDPRAHLQYFDDAIKYGYRTEMFGLNHPQAVLLTKYIGKVTKKKYVLPDSLLDSFAYEKRAIDFQERSWRDEIVIFDAFVPEVQQLLAEKNIQQKDCPVFVRHIDVM